MDKDGVVSESSSQGSYRYLPLTERGGNVKAKETSENAPTDEILKKDAQQTLNSSYSAGSYRGLAKASLENGSRIQGGQNERTKDTMLGIASSSKKPILEDKDRVVSESNSQDPAHVTTDVSFNGKTSQMEGIS